MRFDRPCSILFNTVSCKLEGQTDKQTWKHWEVIPTFNHTIHTICPGDAPRINSQNLKTSQVQDFCNQDVKFSMYCSRTELQTWETRAPETWSSEETTNKRDRELTEVWLLFHGWYATQKSWANIHINWGPLHYTSLLTGKSSSPCRYPLWMPGQWAA